MEIPLLLVASVVAQLLWNYGLIFASLHTVQAHAYTLTSLHGIFYLLMCIMICHRVHKLEYVGSAIIILAAVLIIMDPKATRVGEEVNVQISALSLISNIPGALFWSLNKKNYRKKLTLQPSFSGK